MDISKVKYTENNIPYIRYGKKKNKNYLISEKCGLCGKEILALVRRKHPDHKNYCSPQCAGKSREGNKSPKWRGGFYIHPSGYKWIRIDENHPKAKKGYRYIAEHRAVIEKSLGRVLKKGELIHHLNGIKLDNRLENLAVCTQQNHYDFIKILQRRITELEKLSKLYKGDM